MMTTLIMSIVPNMFQTREKSYGSLYNHSVRTQNTIKFDGSANIRAIKDIIRSVIFSMVQYIQDTGYSGPITNCMVPILALSSTANRNGISSRYRSLAFQLITLAQMPDQPLVMGHHLCYNVDSKCFYLESAPNAQPIEVISQKKYDYTYILDEDVIIDDYRFAQ